MADQIVSKDAWLVQPIGSSTKYGNGNGDLTHVGRIPSGTSDPDYKSRGIFAVELRNGSTGILDGLSSVSAADFELTVAPNTCIVSGRGSNFYAFLEEVTADFTQKTASGDCNFSSGTGSNVWGADSSATTTNRAFVSESGHGTGDKISWDITAMIQAALADPSKTVIRFRAIFANSAGTAYDESAGAPRGCGFYTLEHATSSNRPVLHVTGSSAPIDKPDSDTITLSDDGVAQATGPDVTDVDTISIADSATAGPVPGWSVSTNAEGQGKGSIYIPSSSVSSTALLDGVSETDMLISCKFSLNKIPQNQYIAFWLMGRAQDTRNGYAVIASCFSVFGEAGISVSLVRLIDNSGVALGGIQDLRALLVNTMYNLKLLLLGTSPTILAAKLWRDGEQEPTAYQLTGQDSEAALQVAGTVGIKISASTVSNLPITVTFDDFKVVEP